MFPPRRRSVLFAPAHRDDLLRKMGRSGPDCVVIDLEDGTPPNAKDSARAVAARALAEVDFGGAERILRINAIGTEDSERDLELLRSGQIDPDAVMLPKVDGPDDIDHLLSQAGERVWPVWILPTETALGYANMAASLAHPAVTAAIWAAEDFAADLGASGSRGVDGLLREVFRVARAEMLLSAKAAGVDVIDTTYLEINDLDGLRRETLHCRDLGFDGKAAIHPSHISVINEVYTPDRGEVEAAERLVEAFQAASGGAARFEGRMIDAPHYKQAIRVLQRAGKEQ